MKPPGPFLLVVPEPGDEDPDLARHLAAARELAEPDAQSRARVARALNSALPPSAPLPAFGSGGLPRAARGASLARLAGPWLALGAALIGAAGFGLGLAVGRSDAPPASSAVGTPPRVASGAAVEVAPRPASPAAAAVAAPSSPTAAGTLRDAVSADAPTASARAPLAAAPRGRPAHGEGTQPRRAPAASHAPRLEPAPVLPALDFQQALELLRRAREQLEHGHATMSLLLLSELDRNAGELLIEEREATRVLASCATGQTQAALAAAQRLEQRSPRSIYARRLASSCIGDAPATRPASDGANERASERAADALADEPGSASGNAPSRAH